MSFNVYYILKIIISIAANRARSVLYVYAVHAPSFNFNYKSNSLKIN